MGRVDSTLCQSRTHTFSWTLELEELEAAPVTSDPGTKGGRVAGLEDTMDVPEADFDIKLQKISADLIAELDTLLPNLILKPDGLGGDGKKVRSRVRARELYSLIHSVSAVIVRGNGNKANGLTKAS